VVCVDLCLSAQYIVDMIEDLKNGAIALLGETLFWYDSVIRLPSTRCAYT
jgi:hypothetical protein